jgi:hypothetical protein
MSAGSEFIGRHTVAPITAMLEGGPAAAALVVTWPLWPCLINNLARHPTDTPVIWMWLNNQPIAHRITEEMFHYGIEATIGIAVALLITQFILTCIVYYNAGERFMTVFPAFLTTALIGSAVWWAYTGVFDSAGALEGCSTMAPALGIQFLVERFAMRTIFGPRRQSS